MIINIQTLGDFDILHDGQSVLKDSSRTYKLYRLLQYFITYRGRRLLPETIIDSLYEHGESDDPKNVLRTQIFRLRNLIRNLIDGEIITDKYFRIIYNNGYYSFNLGENLVLDIDEFEKNIKLGKEKETVDIIEALEYYGNALELYKGPYLPANLCEAWLVPIRNKYSIMYIKTLHRKIEILESMDDNYSIIELCEDAFSVEPYEETIHVYLMEAMLRVGQIKNAMSHYTYIMGIFKKELGINPSAAFKNIYGKIQSYYGDNGIDIETTKIQLKEKEFKSELYCESEHFRNLQDTDKRPAFKEDNFGYIGLISINSCQLDGNKKEESQMIEIMSSLLGKYLRKGDVYFFWSDNQILILLRGAKENDLIRIGNRIKDEFNNEVKSKKYNIDINFKPLDMENNK